MSVIQLLWAPHANTPESRKRVTILTQVIDPRRHVMVELVLLHGIRKVYILCLVIHWVVYFDNKWASVVALM